jgi:hypothetical protein
MGFDGPRTASSPSSATFWISDILDHYCHHITLEGNSASYYGTRYGTRRYCTVIYFSLHHITVQGDITSCYGIRKCSIILRYREIYYGTRRYYIMLRYSGKITLQGYSAGQQALLFGMGCSGCSAAQRRSAKAPKHRSTKAQRSVVSTSDMFNCPSSGLSCCPLILGSSGPDGLSSLTRLGQGGGGWGVVDGPRMASERRTGPFRPPNPIA